MVTLDAEGVVAHDSWPLWESSHSRVQPVLYVKKPGERVFLACLPSLKLDELPQSRLTKFL